MQVRPLLIFTFLLIRRAACAETVNVTLVTKHIPPFSIVDGSTAGGYTIDYVQELSHLVFGNAHVNFKILVADGIFEVFQIVAAHVDTPHDIYIGGAAMTITKERENFPNASFLPSYFESGFRVMTHITTASLNDYINTVFDRLVSGLYAISIGAVSIIFVAGVLAWFVEYHFCPKGEYPVFINQELRQSREPLVLWNREILSFKTRLMCTEIMNAFYWVSITLMGTETGYPKSTFALGLHSVLKLISRTAFVLIIAGVTAAFTVTIPRTAITSFENLKGKSICTNMGSTGDSYISDNNIGYNIIRKNSVTEMLDAFWKEDCDAVIYDWPTLQYAIAARGGGAILVGEVFNKESYGLIMSEVSPLFQQFKKETYHLNLEHSTVDDIRSKWLQEVPPNPEQSETEQFSWNTVPWIVYLVPGIALLVLLCLVCVNYKSYDSDVNHFLLEYQRRHDADRQDDFERLLDEQRTSTDYLYWGNDRILDHMYVRSIDQSRMLMRLILQIVDHKDVRELFPNKLAPTTPSRACTEATYTPEPSVRRGADPDASQGEGGQLGFMPDYELEV